MPLVGELRPYQDAAVERFLDEGSLLVSLPTGTGKTVVAIACAEALLDEEEVAWVLVVTPPSLKFQWRRALIQFAPKASVLVVDGTPSERAVQYARAESYDYVIVGYPQLRPTKKKDKRLDDGTRIARLVNETEGGVFIVGDEITAIKGFASQQTKAMKRLDPTFVMGLSAQPIENRADEAFSILEWIDDSVLGSWWAFDRRYIVRNKFGGVQRYQHLDELHKRMAKVMVRRTLDDPEIAPYMPKHTIMEPETVRLEGAARAVYQHVVKDLIKLLEAAGGHFSFSVEDFYEGKGSGSDDPRRGAVMARMVALRMLCAHPYLLVHSASQYVYERPPIGSRYAYDLLHEGMLAKIPKPDQHTPKTREAVDAVEALLGEDPRHKVVVFTFFREMVRLMTEHLAAHGAQAYHGGLSTPQKDSVVQKFSHDSRSRVLVISDAGGYGLDLPVASHMLHLDLPWSAGTYIQRCGRIIRLSSEWSSVIISNLLTEDTVEFFMWDGLGDKMAIANAILDGSGFDKAGTLELQAEQLLAFLKEARP